MLRQWMSRPGTPLAMRLSLPLANELRHEQRNIDLIGRVAGEEFAVLFPGADSVSIFTMDECLRRRAQVLSVEVFSGDGAVIIDTPSCSIIVAVCPGKGGDLNWLLPAADAPRRSRAATASASHSDRDRGSRLGSVPHLATYPPPFRHHAPGGVLLDCATRVVCARLTGHIPTAQSSNFRPTRRRNSLPAAPDEPW